MKKIHRVYAITYKYRESNVLYIFSKYTINKFLKTESNKMYIPYFQM